MTTKTQHSGTHAIVLTCTSPRGTRQVQFMYHYDDKIRTLYGESSSYARNLRAKAAARIAGYERQGWRVQLRTVDLRTVRKGRRP